MACEHRPGLWELFMTTSTISKSLPSSWNSNLIVWLSFYIQYSGYFLWGYKFSQFLRSISIRKSKIVTYIWVCVVLGDTRVYEIRHCYNSHLSRQLPNFKTPLSYWFNLLLSLASLVQANALLLVILVSILLTSLVLLALSTRLAANEWVHNRVTAQLDKGLCCEHLQYNV